MARACASTWSRVILPSRVPGVGDDERARPLMERAERIAFVELSDGHNELFRSVVQSLLLRRTLRPRGRDVRFEHVVLLRCVATDGGPKAQGPRRCRQGPS